ncbi:MAG TPA: hypothetical protein DE313_02060 [Ruminococcus sp.]|nr:hypothetical protein [Ruminococcus sp.]
MKKLSAIFVALLLVAATAITAFAAGINSSEQAVLDKLNGTVTMQGNQMRISQEFVNQAENYFNTIEMTEQESKDIIAIIDEGNSFLVNSGASDFKSLSYDQKQVLLGYGQKAVGVIGMTMSYDSTTRTITVTDPNGNVAFSVSEANYLVPANGSSSGSSGNSSNSGSVIKTTGSDVNYFGFIALGAAAVVLVAGGAMFVVKTKKERA